MTDTSPIPVRGADRTADPMASVVRDRFVDGEADLLSLSALADGEASGHEVERAVAAWARDPSLQQAWRDWHRIGDALRSDDLARPAPSGEDFLVTLRRRLAQAPRPPEVDPADLGVAVRGVPWASRSGAPPAWRMPMALAAGVAAVAVGISLLHPADDGGTVAAGPAPKATMTIPSPPVAVAAPPPPGVMTPRPGVNPSVLAASPGPAAGPQVLIRDPHLDSILRAQRPSAGAAEPAAASGRVETVGLER